MLASPEKERAIALAEKALELAPPYFPPDLPLIPELGAPEWYGFEERSWELGELIRQYFVKTPKLKADRDVLAKVADVIDQTHLRRGRQSFVMLLGNVKAAYLAPRLSLQLPDDDVAGHVVSTLVKMRIAGYTQMVLPHVSSPHAWIRNAAKTYVERYAV
jgi:hypothetical protein